MKINVPANCVMKFFLGEDIWAECDRKENDVTKPYKVDIKEIETFCKDFRESTIEDLKEDGDIETVVPFEVKIQCLNPDNNIIWEMEHELQD